MIPSLQARAAAGAFRAVPDRLVAHVLAHPPRARWVPLVPPWLTEQHDVVVNDVGAGRVAVARPRSGASGRHAFHLHGGAYTLGPAHWDVMRPLLDAGWTVSMVDYPLAPEHTVDTTVSMVIEAWQQATAASSGPVDLLGDSAGGGLALVLLQKVRDHGLVRPGRTVLFSPWVDLAMSDPVTIAADRHDPLLSLRGLRRAADLYSGGRDLSDPALSPINGDLDGLGSIQAWVGTQELFLAQCCRLADLAAIADGTDLELHIGHGLLHDWPLFPLPESRRTLEMVLDYLNGP